MKSAQFTNRDLAVGANRWLEPKFCDQEFGELTTHTMRTLGRNTAESLPGRSVGVVITYVSMEVPRGF